MRTSEQYVSILRDAWIGWAETLARVDVEVGLATELFAACDAGGMEVPFEVFRVCLAELVKMKNTVSVTASDCRRALQDLQVRYAVNSPDLADFAIEHGREVSHASRIAICDAVSGRSLGLYRKIEQRARRVRSSGANGLRGPQGTRATFSC